MKTAGKIVGVTSIAFLMSILLMVAHVVLYVHTLMWVLKISRAKACGCAENWRKQYVVYWPPIAILLGLSMPFWGTASVLLSLIMVVGWVIFILAALDYVKMLRASKCECATSGAGDEVLQVYAYLPIVGWAVSAVMVILMFLILSRAAKKK